MVDGPHTTRCGGWLGLRELPMDSADRTWFYDSAAQNLIVRVHVKASEDSIINLSW
jgi:hypothetical protein